jgi:DNA polymerase-3 subunit epsilon
VRISSGVSGRHGVRRLAFQIQALETSARGVRQVSPVDLDIEHTEFIAFDTETTGLYPVADRLVEIGAVRFRSDGEEIAVYEQLIDPETPIPPEAQEVNQITDEMVKGQPTVEYVLPGFLDFLGSAETALVAQNAPFDIGFIGVDMIRCGVGLPPHLVFDTKVLAQVLLPDLASYSLRSLSRLLGVAEGQEHRALSDARITKATFIALLARNPEIRTIADLSRIAPPVLFEMVRMYQTRPPTGLEYLATAIDEQHRVALVYAGAAGVEEHYEVTPRALLRSNDIIFLAAHCHSDSRERLYRLDLIRDLHKAW